MLPHMFDAVHKGFDGILAPQQLVVLDLLEEERAVVEGGGEAGRRGGGGGSRVRRWGTREMRAASAAGAQGVYTNYT